jgi:hypothetical protein
MTGTLRSTPRGDDGELFWRRVKPKQCRLPSIIARTPTSIAKVPEKIRKFSIPVSSVWRKFPKRAKRQDHGRSDSILSSPIGSGLTQDRARPMPLRLPLRHDRRCGRKAGDARGHVGRQRPPSAHLSADSARQELLSLVISSTLTGCSRLAADRLRRS